jgi:hypothetical protein
MTGSNGNSSFITNIECIDQRDLHTVCPACGKALLARYDLDKAARLLMRDSFIKRDHHVAVS